VVPFFCVLNIFISHRTFELDWMIEKMRDLIIIGAGGYGREIYMWAKHAGGWNIKGFLDSRRDHLKGINNYPPILAAPESYEPRPGDVFTCAIGDPLERSKYVSLLSERKAEFVSIIHPTAIVGQDAYLGIGVILCPYVVVSSGTFVDDYAAANLFVSIGSDAKIGRFVQINPHASIGGGVQLGSFVSVGSNASILPRVVIGQGSNIGAGTVVLQDLEAAITVFGVPAKQIVFPKLVDDRAQG